MGSRRKSRELALQMLFQWDMGGLSPEHIIATFLAAQKLDTELRNHSRFLFEGTVREAESLDGFLREHSEHWRVERMAAVDRNLLRAAVAELLAYPETPRAVVINEALEIARKFSSPESVHFVNGVLDSVGKELEPKGSCQ